MIVNLITDQKVWTTNQLRKRVEKYNLQVQKPGDETLLARVNDAVLFNILPADYDLAGFEKFRNEQYLPRALEAGELGRVAAILNQHLSGLIEIQANLSIFKLTLAQISGDNALSEVVKDELAEDIPNPAYVTAQNNHTTALALLQSVSVADWQLVAQRYTGAVIDDYFELTLAVVNILPHIDLLEFYIESDTSMNVDKRRSLESNKQLIIDALTPVQETLEELVE